METNRPSLPFLVVSFGNKKLPKDTTIFNLPAVATCPGRTALCAGVCYALKAERMYKAVLPARQRNFEATRDRHFVADMALEIGKHVHKIKRVRVHESGDFYNQAYLNAWYEIARQYPRIRFYAYTKSFHLDFSARPANFWLIASLDTSTTPAQLARYESQREYFQNTFTIVDRHAPKTRQTCPGDCSKCNRCWTATGKTITVNQH